MICAIRDFPVSFLRPNRPRCGGYATAPRQTEGAIGANPSGGATMQRIGPPLTFTPITRI
ncbi:hypothetical protein BVG79_00091 [Ketogulonicigenium robustum]|uniref:Uncharacterized protein n=1 Tax=Ketogulonicigenium robustum TaxID=92947 RepID=A0A1W6NW61_9RHOB|nr:hypothetical protein BVG79_00091 [Ketogulonicigenium robustum]